MKVEEIATEKLVPYVRNAKLHSASQVSAIVGSIREFGFCNPVLVDKDNGIIAGHGRVMAAQQMGLKKVPCIRLGHLTDNQRRAYILADNRLAEIGGGWDVEMAKLEIADIDWGGLEYTSIDDYDWGGIEMMGADDDEDEPDRSDVDAEPQVDKADELREKWGTKTGQLWELGEHRLLCGDSTNADDVARALDGAKPLLMVTDPPYGVEYDPGWRADAGVNKNKGKMGKVENDDKADWREAWALFDGDALYVYHAGAFSKTVQESIEVCGFEIRAQIIWAKDRMALSRGDYHWKHEPCWYAVRKGRPGHRNDDRTQTTLWEIVAREDLGHGHSTQKPIECMARPIRNHDSEYVYEPFSGSGTTIIACEQLGRKCRAIEISPAYVAVAIQRWADATGKKPKLIK
jgi:DNA modification methylase